MAIFFAVVVLMSLWRNIRFILPSRLIYWCNLVYRPSCCTSPPILSFTEFFSQNILSALGTERFIFRLSIWMNESVCAFLCTLFKWFCFVALCQLQKLIKLMGTRKAFFRYYFNHYHACIHTLWYTRNENENTKMHSAKLYSMFPIFSSSTSSFDILSVTLNPFRCVPFFCNVIISIRFRCWRYGSCSKRWCRINCKWTAKTKSVTKNTFTGNEMNKKKIEIQFVYKLFYRFINYGYGVLFAECFWLCAF